MVPFSQTVTSIPALCRNQAAVMPAMPPPTISTSLLAGILGVLSVIAWILFVE
jgi:hypothetical protein